MRKILAFLTTILFLFVSCAAAETADASLERVTLLVKQQIDIGDDYDDFYGESYQSEVGTFWSLNWSSEDGKSLYVSCTDGGRITDLYASDPNLDNYRYSSDFAPRFPEQNRQQLLASAEAFMRSVLDAREGFAFDEDAWNSGVAESDTIFLRGKLTLNGLPTETGFDISFRAADFSVRSYSRYDGYLRGYLLAGNAESFSVEPSIDADSAENLLKSKLSLALKYVTSSDDSNLAVLRYLPNGEGIWVVDAATGELIDRQQDDSIYYKGAETAAMDRDAGLSAANGVRLSEAERAGVDLMKDVFSADSLEMLLRNKPVLGITQDFSLESAYYFVRKDTGEIRATLTFQKKLDKAELMERYSASENDLYGYQSMTLSKHFELNAKTGALISFSTDHPYIYGTYDYTVDAESGRAIAEDFLRDVLPDVFSQTDLTNTTTRQSNDYYIPVADYQYTRMHNGIPYDADAIFVSVNTDDGTIDTLRYSWTEELSFQESDAVLPLKEATDAYKALFQAELFYATLSGQDADGDYVSRQALCYDLSAETALMGLDAVTGAPVSDVPQAETRLTYDDLDSCEYPEEIESLAAYGIGYEGGSILPEDALVYRDMLRLLISASSSATEDRSDAQLVLLAKSMHIPVPENVDLDATVSRTNFARTLIEMSGYGKAASLSDIFLCGFADADQIAPEDYGYIAIAQGMGIATADEEGLFHPAYAITREAAAVMFYHFLDRKI